jgi:alpha-L-fucosidase
MWNTEQSDFNIVDATPFKRDVVKELAGECRKQGIKFGVYYSHLDWGRDDYYPLGRTGHNSGRTAQGKWEDYRKFMDAQLTELLTDYGPMHQIWFDGWWDQKYAVDWKLEEQYALIHRLQPGCLVGNNHHEPVKDGEDFQMFEQDLPGQNRAGMSGGSRVGNLPLETCQTMNDTWAYKIDDLNYKSTRELIQYLVKAAGNNANLLLNVGPQPNGEIPAASLERMKEIGAWMRLYGGSVYGTRGGPVPQRDWGVTTKKDGKVFVHILNLQDTALYLPITEKVKKATVFADGTPVRFTQDKDGLVLKLAAEPTEIDCVVQLEF